MELPDNTPAQHIEMTPEEKTRLVLLFEADIRRKNYARAGRYIQLLIEFEPNNAEFIERNIRHAVCTGNIVDGNKIRSSLRQLRILDPENIRIIETEIRFMIVSRDRTNTQRTWRMIQALRLRFTGSINYLRLEIQFLIAMDHLEPLVRAKKLVRLIEELRKRTPDTPDFFELEARVWITLGRHPLLAISIEKLSFIPGSEELVAELTRASKQIKRLNSLTKRNQKSAAARKKAKPRKNASFVSMPQIPLSSRPTISIFSRSGAGLLVERFSVINALAYLEIRQVYGKRSMGYAAAAITPFFMLVMIYILFAVIRNKQPGNMPLEVFILTGVTVWFVFLNAMSAMIAVARKPTRMLVHQVLGRFDLKIAALLVAVLPVVTLGTFIGCGLFLAGYDIHINSVLLLLGSILLAVLFGYSVGIIIGVLSIYAEIVMATQMFIKRGLFFMSGIFFSIDELPVGMQDIIQYIPLAHLIEGVRYSLSDTYPARNLSLPLAMEVIGGFLLLAVILEGLQRRHKNN